MFKDKLRRADVKAIGYFALAWPVAAAAKIFLKDVWLISERPKEARDNGYWLFQYICTGKLHKQCYYLIHAKAVDRHKVEKLGKTIAFGSFAHYVYYILAAKHISSQVDGGMPNARVCGFLERHGLLKNKKAFLQHGITKDKISFGYYKVSRADLFVCATEKETAFVRETFGYPQGAVQELGFARFDNLSDCSAGNRLILIMPTWRAWLAKGKSENFSKARKKFMESEYFHRWKSLLNNDDLCSFLQDNNYKVLFYPHSDMQPYIDLFGQTNSRIQIAHAETYDVQELLKCANVLLTDYSSVAFDFAYMNKPLAYYHFDYEAYRKGQHPEGYFQYPRDGFGPVLESERELVEYLKKVVEADGENQTPYVNRVKTFFDLKDRENCKRIVAAIEKL